MNWRPRAPLAQRLWAFVDRRGPDECWPWRGCVNERGYGRIGTGVGNYLTYAHRAAWEVTFGIPPGMCVLHRCDVPPCCNPAHLYLGTRADNNADMARKGRAPRGPERSNTKLTEAKVLEIRASSDSYRQLADVYGVSRRTVADVKKRKLWAWL